MDMRIVVLIFAGSAGSLSVSAEPATRAANPASAFCVKNGATIIIETDENAQRGICVFPDGKRIAEWTYFQDQSRVAK